MRVVLLSVHGKINTRLQKDAVCMLARVETRYDVTSILKVG